MATIIGQSGRYTTEQSVRIFQRMLVTTMLAVAAIGVFEGIVVATLFWQGRSLPVIFLFLMSVGLGAVWWLCRYQCKNIDRYERRRTSWRKGTVGEHAVLATLESLPAGYFVINDVKIGAANLDHLVVGPTGLFAIETKNWRGVVTADGKGELISNGIACPKPHVRRFLGRSMSVLEQIRSLARRNGIFIRAIMVFPKAWLEVPYTSTGRVHCVTDETLCSYIQDPKYSDNLTPENVGQIARALEAVARMEPDFATKSTAAVNRSKSESSVVATVVPNRTQSAESV